MQKTGYQNFSGHLWQQSGWLKTLRGIHASSMENQLKIKIEITCFKPERNGFEPRLGCCYVVVDIPLATYLLTHFYLNNYMSISPHSFVSMLRVLGMRLDILVCQLDKEVMISRIIASHKELKMTPKLL